MLTLFLIITLTNFKIISGEENSDTKFINSLPEKQKKEFLQKVEKRIQNEVPEVKSPELNDTNVDLYEKRLEDQSKSVQNILRSEIENLKTHHRRNLNDTGRIEASYIDLTLRTINENSEATRRKNQESNNPESDSHSKEDSEKQPHLVPVYNYDPENAYYNANNQQSQSNVEGGSIIKIKETRSKSNFDVNTNENKKSLRVKDVKERIISNDKIKPTFDLYDVILSDVSEESSEDSVLIEKPLKHTLKKIRTKLHRNKMNGKSKDDVNNNDIITIIAGKEHKGDYSSNTNKNDKHGIIELFTNFGALLQNLVDRANDNETPSSEGIKDSDKETYKEIANSLENHNKILKNQGLQQIVNIVKHIQDKAGEKRLKQNNNKRNKKEHQYRFHIKDRDEKYKQKQEEIYTSLDHNDINYPNFGSQDTKFNKSASKINDDYLEIHINNLKNLIDRNDLGLKKYDWLGTTVLIQAGLEKMQELTDKKLRGKKLHHLDQKLLDFVIKLYETANEIIESQANEQNLSPRRRKKPKKENLDIFKVLIGMDISTILESRSKSKAEDFKEFLDCLEMCLNDLHTAIKQVSLITTYKKQRWFENIKQLYLQSADEKEYLELFLHLVMTRLIDLIDARVKKMNSEGYNLKRDKVEVDRIEVEFVLAMRICNKLEELKQ
ncbi:GATA zinc finger domain-containing protein 14-like isoform X2 [Cydia splendana]|uniref:GATA zinc finger domain-containing protein 14-like isoform X2 n=1 Tax=Cydia splendana TaxID=1100963 RepID=UPI00300DA693